MEINDKLAYRIHGIISSDSDSDDSAKNFDEEYALYKPPPLSYDSIKDNIIKIRNTSTQCYVGAKNKLTRKGRLLSNTCMSAKPRTRIANLDENLSKTKHNNSSNNVSNNIASFFAKPQKEKGNKKKITFLIEKSYKHPIIEIIPSTYLHKGASRNKINNIKSNLKKEGNNQEQLICQNTEKRRKKKNSKSSIYEMVGITDMENIWENIHCATLTDNLLHQVDTINIETDCKDNAKKKTKMQNIKICTHISNSTSNNESEDKKVVRCEPSTSAREDLVLSNENTPEEMTSKFNQQDFNLHECNNFTLDFGDGFRNFLQSFNENDIIRYLPYFTYEQLHRAYEAYQDASGIKEHYEDTDKKSMQEITTLDTISIDEHDDINLCAAQIGNTSNRNEFKEEAEMVRDTLTIPTNDDFVALSKENDLKETTSEISTVQEIDGLNELLSYIDNVLLRVGEDSGSTKKKKKCKSSVDATTISNTGVECRHKLKDNCNVNQDNTIKKEVNVEKNDDNPKKYMQEITTVETISLCEQNIKLSNTSTLSNETEDRKLVRYEPSTFAREDLVLSKENTPEEMTSIVSTVESKFTQQDVNLHEYIHNFPLDFGDGFRNFLHSFNGIDTIHYLPYFTYEHLYRAYRVYQEKVGMQRQNSAMISQSAIKDNLKQMNVGVNNKCLNDCLNRLSDDAKTQYYKYVGKKLQHFMEFRETFIYKSLYQADKKIKKPLQIEHLEL